MRLKNFLMEGASDGAGGSSGGGQPGAGGQGGGGGAQSAWHGFTEAADVSYVENKGWKAPADVVASYRSAEKLIGRDPSTVLIVPRADDAAGLRGALTRLGLPESADKYEFSLPDGQKADDGFVTWAKTAFHKVGLLPGQVKELTADYNKFFGDRIGQAEKDYNLRVTTDKQALLKEWGDGHERMLSAAQSAANNLGFTGPMIDAIERELGYAGTWKFLAGLGQKMAEDQFEGGGSRPGGFGKSLTPQEAKAEFDSLRADQAHVTALMDKTHPGHKQAQEKENRLFAVMYPEQKK